MLRSLRDFENRLMLTFCCFEADTVRYQPHRFPCQLGWWKRDNCLWRLRICSVQSNRHNISAAPYQCFGKARHQVLIVTYAAMCNLLCRVHLHWRHNKQATICQRQISFQINLHALHPASVCVLASTASPDAGHRSHVLSSICW